MGNLTVMSEKYLMKMENVCTKKEPKSAEELFSYLYILLGVMIKSNYQNVTSVQGALDISATIISNELQERTGRFYRKDYGSILKLYTAMRHKKMIGTKQAIEILAIANRINEYINYRDALNQKVIAEESRR